jgi:hypothetical protein
VPVSNCRPRPTRHRPKTGAPARASVRPLRRAVDRLSPTCGSRIAPSLSPPAIRVDVGGKYLVEVSSVVSSLPASHRATGPFFNSFGGFTPLTHALLLPQFARSSGKDFGLHRYPAEVSSVVSSLPASHRATGPFFNSFGGFTPLTRALLLPQFARSSGKDFGLHRTSRR